MKRAPLAHERVFEDLSFAEKYATRHQKMATKFGREYTEKLTSRGFQKGRILDVGCGFGGTAMVLAENFPQCEVVGIDLSEPLLEMANEAARSAHLEGRARFERADVQEIPYEPDSFDVVLNLNMVHIVEDPVAMLNEIERVLVPNGVLFIADIRRSWVGYLDPAFRSALTFSEAQTLLQHV